MSFLIGIVGYILYFVYDLNQVYNWHKVLKLGFSLGSLLVLIGTLLECSLDIKNYWAILILVIGIMLEIYVLFFALDFKNTYVDEEFKVNDHGVYALCRHPGFYSFLLIYLGLYLMYLNDRCLVMLVLYNMLNLLYIIFQDSFVFPKLFKDYRSYKKTTPFLLFNKQSICKCINDFRGI